jgi:glycosyltransferase involved in cell wall biosynthesis
MTMLLTDGFGGFGGIAKFNRDLLEALNLSVDVDRVHVLPRLIPEPIAERLPEAVIYNRHAADGKLAFVRQLAHAHWRGEPCDLVLCGHINLLTAAWSLARRRRARLVLIVHGIECWQPTGRVLCDRLAPRIDALIAVSQHSAARFRLWSGVPEDRVSILPNNVALQRFRPQARDPALVARYGLAGSRVLLTVGRLASAERYKGFDQVIEAMPRLLQRFPDVKYLIVGDGPDRTRLTAKAERLSVSDSIVFAGRIAEDEKVAHYNLADAFVMPSSGEGFGIVLIEAAACGLPIVGSSIDGSREALLEGELGQLVDPRVPDELVQAVTAILARPHPRARNDLVQRFGVREFRAKVADWCRAQAAGRAA